MNEQNPDLNDNSSRTQTKNEIIPGYSTIDQFIKEGFKTLMEAIKCSNTLPMGRDWDFYNISDSFKKIINHEGNEIMGLMNHVMRSHDVGNNIRNRILDEKFELVVEANDVILEKVANNIDELNGIRKTTAAPVVLQTVSAQLPINGSWNRPNTATFTVNNSPVFSSGEKNCVKLLTAKNIIRPQKFFKDKVDNRNNIPWYPRITDKPNSLKPLAIFLEEFEDRTEYSHPYELELDRFAPTPEQLCFEKLLKPKILSFTPLIEIHKPEQLDELLETLRSCKELAVDVEHHSYRSFMGFTCLLQISTLENDYLIDALTLRDKLHVLNEVFTKNSIVKIFHGAEKDIEWLQRDLSIYVVNMFDTHQAAKVLQYSGLSLAFLLKKFCNVVANKQFQLADWRMRPLPQELKQYAREDTHYLIYIYKTLKAELLLKANKSDTLLRCVLERSAEICKKRYFKPMLLDDSHMSLFRKCKKLFDNRQMYALKEIYSWRDNIAREEDESLGYVLPNHMLLQISETLPREMQGILACCNPIPPLVRSHLLELHHLVLKAREQTVEKAILKDTTGRGVLKKVTKENVDSMLHCPHDLSKSQEFRDDLPTLMKNKTNNFDNRLMVSVDLHIEKFPSYSIFGDSDNENCFNERKTLKELRGFAYLSPYERYKMIKPFVVAEDEQEKVKENDRKEEDEIRNKECNMGERTDADRIASIKEHFMQLSREFSEEVQKKKEEEEQRQKQQTLLQMGGSRKRKREQLQHLVQEHSVDNQFRFNFHNPEPNMRSNFYQNRSRGKKRNLGEATDNQSQQLAPKKKRNRKRNNLQQIQTNYNPNNAKQLQKMQNRLDGSIHQPNNQKALQKKKQFKSKQNVTQNRQGFAPYDYASVDFRQFQGGASSVNTGVQIKHKFKPKNRPNRNNKKGAKSSILGNINAERTKPKHTYFS